MLNQYNISLRVLFTADCMEDSSLSLMRLDSPFAKSVILLYGALMENGFKEIKNKIGP